MATGYSPQIVTDGLVLALDAANVKSFRGVPTVNLLANEGLSTYNNVGGDVSSVLVSTSETYKGATVWKQTLTPLTNTGVSYLSNGNNPGIGVVTGGGGGLANRYTGHAIFYKPTFPTHSTPLFTNYSNIPGWGAGSLGSNRSVNQGDGWFRGEVLWFDTVTRTDGKYWAINPQTVTLNVPIEVFWAGPFKEDRNDSTHVSVFVNGTRGTTVATGGGWEDRSGNSNHGELVNGPTYNSSNLGSLVFDGVNDYVDVGSLGSGFANFTVEIWFKSDDVANYRNPIDCNWLIENGSYSNIGPRLEQTTSGNLTWVVGSGNDVYSGLTLVASGLNPVPYHHAVITKTSSTTFYGYYNGNYITNLTFSNWPGSMLDVNVGRGFSTSSERWFIGKIPSVKIYNRALTAAEVIQNYNATKGRYGL